MADNNPACCWEFEDSISPINHTRTGLDEAGRGCLAGPVVAAAARVLRRDLLPPGITDSKRMTRTARRRIFNWLCDEAGGSVIWAVGKAEVQEIDSLNILQASFLAMHRAAQAIHAENDFLLVDGHLLPSWAHTAQAVVQGDLRCPSIALASIIAKESRDRIMEELADKYPVYGFENHKGYGTKAHMEALCCHGVCTQHRISFAPVARIAQSS